MSLGKDIKVVAKEFEQGLRHNGKGTALQLDTSADQGLQHNPDIRARAKAEIEKKMAAAAAKPAPMPQPKKPVIFRAPATVLKTNSQIQEDADYALALSMQFAEEDVGYRPNNTK